MNPYSASAKPWKKREQGQAAEVVRRQLQEGLQGLTGAADSGLIVAYEPVWAIGTGQAATPEIAQEIMGGVIRAALLDQFPGAVEVPILYGGSVNPGNVLGYLAQPDINGALVGGASLDADQFLELVRLAESES